MGIRLVYLLGNARSGSTVASALFGAHPEIEPIGELCQLVPEGFEADHYCACGSRFSTCPFWMAMRTRWEELFTAQAIRDYEAVRQHLERSRHGLRTPSSAAAALYRKGTQTLLQSISTIAGRDVILDASKAPLRALRLAGVAKQDVRVIQLVRDARGVAWSIAQSYARNLRGGIQNDTPGRPVWRTALVWCFLNWWGEQVLARLGPDRAMLLRYEDLVSTPERLLPQVGRFLQMDFSGQATPAATHTGYPTRHIVAGNRARMRGTILLHPDRRWQVEMPRGQQRLVRWLAWPWLKRYGYLTDEGRP